MLEVVALPEDSPEAVADPASQPVRSRLGSGIAEDDRIQDFDLDSGLRDYQDYCPRFVIGNFYQIPQSYFKMI